MKSVTIKVKGRVQGVNFRYYTRQEALGLGITGTVMNLEDGSVLINAEGEDAKLHAFIEWCRHGPSRARVESLELGEKEPKGFTDFLILR